MLDKYFQNEYDYFDENKPEFFPKNGERVKEESVKFEVEYYRKERANRIKIGYVNKQNR